MKRKLFSLFLALAMVLPSFVIPAGAAGHTYYSQYGNGTGVDNKLCYLTSFAMVISDLGYQVSPYDVYKANGSTPVADFYRLGKAYGVTEYYRPQSGKTGAEKKQTIIRALQSGDYPEGFLVCTVVNGSVHMIVARKVVNGEVYFDCPANGCCITLGQTGHSPGWNNVTSYFGFIPNKNWKGKNYTVTFDAEGGSVHPTSITVPEGSNNWELPTPTRSGYKFRGWGLYSNGSAGNVIVDYPWTITEDMTLYATWTEECTSHSYKTVERNGQYTAVCKSCSKEFVLDSLDTSVKGTYKPASGYVTLCSAPYQDADVAPTTGEVQIVGAVKNAYDSIWYKTSDGHWILGKYLKKVEAKSYTIYFDAEGGKVYTGSMVVTNGKTFGALPTPTRSGYKFNGWMYDDAKNGVCVRVDSNTKVNLSGDTTLYAIWSKEECKNHTKGDYLYCDKNHPHYNYYECANCGETFTDGKTRTVDSCTTCNPKPEKCTSHTKGSYLFYEAAHPHYHYYECANCGARFTDGTTGKMDSCTTCNPPPKEPVWGEWSSWSDTEVTQTATRQVEKKKIVVEESGTYYRYGRYVDSTGSHNCWCGKYLESRSYANGKAHVEYSEWSETRYNVYDSGWTCGECNAKHIGSYETDRQGREFWYEYKLPGNESYYWEETAPKWGVVRYEYRYRDLITH